MWQYLPALTRNIFSFGVATKVGSRFDSRFGGTSESVTSIQRVGAYGCGKGLKWRFQHIE